MKQALSSDNKAGELEILRDNFQRKFFDFQSCVESGRIAASA